MLNDSHYHLVNDMEVPIQSEGPRHLCTHCNPHLKKKGAVAAVVATPEAELSLEGKPNLAKHATNPPTSRKYRP